MRNLAKLTEQFVEELKTSS